MGLMEAEDLRLRHGDAVLQQVWMRFGPTFGQKTCDFRPKPKVLVTFLLILAPFGAQSASFP